MDNKSMADHLEEGSPPADPKADLDAAQSATSFDEVEEKRIIRKIDWHIVPVLGVLYLMSFIDRSNIGNAKIAGMDEDLDLDGMRYNTAVTVFFVTYSLFEVPSNIMLKLWRPSVWIAVICFSWGLVMTLMGLVNSYEGLVIARIFLGVAEAGFFPAAAYLLTLWYKRFEVQTRMAIFYAAASLAGAFSGLLAFAIENMDGVGGLAAWKWIFILEGLVPVVISFTLYWLLADSPENARFLTEDERRFAASRLYTETGYTEQSNSDRIQMKYIKAAFADWKTWVAVVCFWSCSIGIYGFTATAPTAIKQLGYTSANAQLMTIPIYTFVVITTIGVATWSDRPDLPGVTYFFLFLIAGGLFCPFTSIVTLIGNNLAPSSKRAVGLAILASVGNMGGICGSNIYLARQAPQYPVGYGTCLGACVAGIVAAIVLRIAYASENKRKAALLRDEGEEAVRARYSEQELVDLGDKSPFFEYTL
ncbi:major facilitator superfamily domain-containing protein [Aspergillus keveii]|uniref:Major facilitator superfamily domain-containing protein n=1 Tax=Aspergillus keveii TaxID=714993 RepID=A0ABR4FN52_9EURO